MAHVTALSERAAGSGAVAAPRTPAPNAPDANAATSPLDMTARAAMRSPLSVMMAAARPLSTTISETPVP